MQTAIPGNRRDNLIENILKDAKSEADRIVGEARKKAEEKRNEGKERSERIRREAKVKTDDEAQKIRAASISKTERTIRRERLRTRERIIQIILEKAREAILSLIDTPEYRDIIKDWILEAAIGLNAGEADVNASRKEETLISDSLLKEVAAEFKAVTGNEIILRKSREDPSSAQGIVLTSGHVAFNNQVNARFLRYQSEIRKIIHENLVEEK